jgi:hypothetical protein
MVEIMSADEIPNGVRRCDHVRLAASTSFSADEVSAIDMLIRTLLRGGSIKHLSAHPAVHALARKVESMKRSIARQKKRRETHEASLGRPDPARWRV